jgi:hypothetical protein
MERLDNRPQPFDIGLGRGSKFILCRTDNGCFQRSASGLHRVAPLKFEQPGQRTESLALGILAGFGILSGS